MIAAEVQQQILYTAVLGRPMPGVPVQLRPVRRLHCVDVSNYTDRLTPEALKAWETEHDIGLVIVQAVSPPAPYPLGVTRSQLQACAAAGIPTDVYLYWWVALDPEADMRQKLAMLNGIEHLVGRLWLDLEDNAAATAERRITSIRQALAVLDGWSSAHRKPRPGIYSARWFWVAYVDNTTEFSDRALWCAQYDDIDDPAVFSPFGGWARCEIKQWKGTSTLAGIGGVDLNVLAP